MSDYIDAILHIANLPALISAMPADQVQEGVVMDFARTPVVMNGIEALVYIRMTETEAVQWRGTPGVTILVEVPYVGTSTPDLVYQTLVETPAALATYNAVYPRTPVQWTDENGTHDYTPPFRFGAMG